MSGERTRTRETRSDEDDDAEFDAGRDASTTRDRRATVSDRTSWSGLAKRAYNVAVSDSRTRSGTDTGGSAKLALAMFAGAFVGGLIPFVPLTWLLGLGVGAAVGGWADEGSPLVAGAVGALVGLVGGLGFAGALFGLGIVLVPVLTLVGAVVGGFGFLLGAGR